MSLSLTASADGLSLDLKLGATLITTFSTSGIEAGVLLASDAEAQTFTNLKKLLTPARLDGAFKGANQSLVTNGYQRLPGGLILQWGTSANVSANSGLAVTLPIAFPNNFFNLSVTRRDTAAGSTAYAFYGNINSLSQFTMYNGTAGTLNGHWFAIGN